MDQNGQYLAQNDPKCMFRAKFGRFEDEIIFLLRKCAILTPKLGYFGQKVFFLYWNCNFCQKGISPVHPGLQFSHSDQPKQNFGFRAMGHFLGLTPFLGRFGPFPNHYDKYPYFWTFSTNLVETSGPSKKWPRMTEDQNRLQGPGVHCLKIEATHQINVFISVFNWIGDHIWQKHCLYFINT